MSESRKLTGTTSQDNIDESLASHPAKYGVGHARSGGAASGIMILCISVVILILGFAVLGMSLAMPGHEQDTPLHGHATHALVVTGSVCLISGGALAVCGIVLYIIGYRRRKVLFSQDKEYQPLKVEDAAITGHDAPSHVM